jgi:hypothetical protein
MEGVKQISVTLTPEDVKAISRSKTRKRKSEEGEDYIPARRRKRGGAVPEDLTIDLDNPEVSPQPPVATNVPQVQPPVATNVPQVQLPVATNVPQVQLPVATNVPQDQPPVATNVSQVQPPVATNAPQPTTGGKIRIQTRKRTHKAPTETKPLVPMAAKILPIKRFAPVAAKPKLVIPPKTMKAPKMEKNIPHNLPKPDMKNETKNETKEAVKHEKPKKRRFTERRLSISVDTVVKTRKHRKTVKIDVDSMPLEEIRAKLVARGILRKTAKVPDSMLRSMMKDLMLLNAPE